MNDILIISFIFGILLLVILGKIATKLSHISETLSRIALHREAENPITLEDLQTTHKRYREFLASIDTSEEMTDKECFRRYKVWARENGIT